MMVRRPRSVSVSQIALRLGSSARTLNMPLPPMPSSGLRMVSPSSSTKAWILCGSRLTRVVAAYSGNSVMASFSEWSRIARGSLKTLAPACTARSSSQVAVTYSKSKGGSWRISTASKALSGCTRCSPATYQSWSSARGSIASALATTAPSRQASASRWMVHTAWPRRAASRIIAMLESL